MATAMTPLSDSTDDSKEVETLPAAEKQSRYQRCVKSSRKRLVIVVVVTAVLAVVVGFLIGYFVPKPKDVCKVNENGAREDVHDQFEDRVSAAELETEFR